jgi:hypothetical protein
MGREKNSMYKVPASAQSSTIMKLSRRFCELNLLTNISTAGNNTTAVGYERTVSERQSGIARRNLMRLGLSKYLIKQINNNVENHISIFENSGKK